VTAHAGEALAARTERYRALVDAELRAAVGDDPAPLYGLMRYHLGWIDAAGAPAAASPGKQLRSTLLLLVAELCGGEAAAAAPAAAAIELLHNFSLLHDDIEDESAERRGRPTVWTVAGVAQAINAGDGMHVLARAALYRLDASDTPPTRVLEAMRELDRACLRLVEGQHLDLAFERQARVTRAEYLAMAAGKTGALIAASCAIGAILGGAAASRVEALRDFGQHLGMAFQAIDDVLGIWGDPAVTGKPAGDDLRARKMTLPVIAALEAGGPYAAGLAAAYGHPAAAGDDVATLAGLVEAGGGRDAAGAFARESLAASFAALDRAGLDAVGAERCRELAVRLVERTF